MKYYSYNYKWDLFRNGIPILSMEGDMLQKHEEYKRDKFWNYFNQYAISSEPPDPPSFNFIKWNSKNKIENSNILGEFYSFGLILSSKFKHFLESSRLGKHYFYNVVLKHGQHFNYDYYFFCLGERSFNAIDFTKSHFYFPDNTRYAYYREKHINSLIKFNNFGELIRSINNKIHPPVAYNICIKKDFTLDLIDLSFLSHKPTYYFSEELVDKITRLNLAPNLEFIPLNHIEY